ncbi:hypothetical protein K3495_g6882 [Podosphaera aphanis]|nr:hypothetical protein K3495_g6882 [Podosphaera aphanis]
MMDLTSMLNGNSGAVEQLEERSQQVILKSPRKTRTPWDAGGYSLPIDTVSVTPQYRFQGAEANTSASASPRHFSSESLYSLTSSSTGSHIHSISTSTSESFQASNNMMGNIYESPSPKTAASSYSLDLSTDELDQASLSQINLSRSMSLASSVAADPNSTRVMWNQFQRSQNLGENLVFPIRTKQISTIESAEEKRRPSSPSDAILIKRSTTPNIRLIIEDSRLKSQHEASLNRNYRSATEGNQSHPLDPSIHKRAISVPNFHLSSNPHGMEVPARGISQDEITPPSSHHPDHPSPILTALHQPPATPPFRSPDSESQLVKCMYIPNCDTGSQLRKAISHIFGRNKICTRQIPSHVWVHYCRKHYQRSRYRNPKEYAKLQCDLVQQQIRRVHDWSQSNAAYGRNGVVQDWSISVRKREQKRLDDLERGRKRKSVSLDEQDIEDEDFKALHLNNASSAIPATAVPAWLLEHCRKGYSTPEILAIFSRLHKEILDDTISTFPDIEILPNISIDQDEPWSSKKCVRRPQTAQHKRAKSLSVGMGLAHLSGDSRASKQQSVEVDASSFSSPASKYYSSNFVDSQLLSRYRTPKAGRRGPAQSLHSHVEENSSPTSYYNFSPLSKQSLLSIPISDSNQQMESASYQIAPQQNIHQRSQSDVGSFMRSSSMSHVQGISSYSPIYTEENFRGDNYEPDYPPPAQSFTPRDDEHTGMRSLHGRYHSLPMASLLYTNASQTMREYPNSIYSHSMSSINAPLQTSQTSED